MRRGQHVCQFVAREVAEWASCGDPRAARSLAALPFPALRALVRERFARDPENPLPEEIQAPGAMDREAAAVHIWGPVMVLPVRGTERDAPALELLSRDPAASAVSVIVVDLGGAIIDEAFGALALEQLVQTAEGWGAEVIFVDPSPLSAGVLADLEHPPLLIEKDLEAGGRARVPDRPLAARQLGRAARSRARSASLAATTQGLRRLRPRALRPTCRRTSLHRQVGARNRPKPRRWWRSPTPGSSIGRPCPGSCSSSPQARFDGCLHLRARPAREDVPLPARRADLGRVEARERDARPLAARHGPDRRDDYHRVSNHVAEHKVKEGRRAARAAACSSRRACSSRSRSRCARGWSSASAGRAAATTSSARRRPPEGAQPFRADLFALIQEGIETHWSAERVLADLAPRMNQIAVRNRRLLPRSQERLRCDDVGDRAARGARRDPHALARAPARAHAARAGGGLADRRDPRGRLRHAREGGRAERRARGGDRAHRCVAPPRLLWARASRRAGPPPRA